MSCLRRRGAHDALYDVGGKLLHHVDGVVNVQLFQYSGQLRVRDGVYHLLLLRSVKICENLRRRLLRQESEYHWHAVVADLRKELRNVKLLHILQPLLETLHIAPVKKLGQLFVLPLVDGLKVHGGLLFFVILQWTHLL